MILSLQMTLAQRYKKNPDYNNVISVDSKTFKESGWKTKIKVVKFIRNEIERRIGLEFIFFRTSFCIMM